MTDPNTDAFAHQVGLTEERGKQLFDDHWESAVKALMRKVEDGSLDRGAVVAAVMRPNAAENIFAAGISEVDEREWRRWRDGQPHRKARIDRTTR